MVPLLRTYMYDLLTSFADHRPILLFVSSSPRESSDSGTGVPVWSFEIRVVHGSDEIHSLIRKAALKAQPPDKPTSTAAAASAASASAAPQETMTNGVWAIAMKSILESEQDFLLRVNTNLFSFLNSLRPFSNY